MGNFSIVFFLIRLMIVAFLPFFVGSQVGDQTSCLDQRIEGGCNAVQGQLPYQLSIQADDHQLCGATLIKVEGIQLAITSVYCICYVNLKYITVVAGDLKLSDQTGLEQVRKIKQVFCHEKHEYEATHFINDIAIAILDDEFELNEHVSVIPLPAADEEVTEDLIISGFSIYCRNSRVPDDLRVIRMPVVDHDECKKKWKSHPEDSSEILEGMICVGDPNRNKTVCSGDKGGPAVSKISQRFTGILSFYDIQARNSDYPIVLTKISHYVDWIHSKVSEWRNKLVVSARG